jgi:two-component system sensor histidine kinase DesK
MSIVLSGDPTRANWYQIVPLVLLVRGLGLDMLGFTRLAQALLELHSARAELARLAVVEERLRLARDLHDLLGQKLSTITLKSALAARLAESEPGRAALEMREVEEVARQTLREVREAVAGYRQPRLESELTAARSLLEAAVISLKVEESPGELDSATNSALAWAIREGVTNLIKHSRARHCSIRLARENGFAVLELVNDGIGEKLVTFRPGNGLEGLMERVGALEGRVEAGPVNTPGKILFRLRVELPLEKPGAS